MFMYGELPRYAFLCFLAHYTRLVLGGAFLTNTRNKIRLSLFLHVTLLAAAKLAPFIVDRELKG